MQLIAKDFMAVAAAAAVALHPSSCVLSPVLPAAGPLALARSLALDCVTQANPRGE